MNTTLDYLKHQLDFYQNKTKFQTVYTWTWSSDLSSQKLTKYSKLLAVLLNKKNNMVG